MSRAASEQNEKEKKKKQKIERERVSKRASCSSATIAKPTRASRYIGSEWRRRQTIIAENRARARDERVSIYAYIFHVRRIQVLKRARSRVACVYVDYGHTPTATSDAPFAPCTRAGVYRPD